MKQIRFFRTATFALFVFFLAAQSSAWAQSQPQRGAFPPSHVGTPGGLFEFPPEVKERRVEQVVLDQLPLSEVVNYLRETFPEINFIIPTGATVPDSNQGNQTIHLDDVIIRLRLNDANLPDILTAISLATDERVIWRQVGDRLVTFQAPASNPFLPPQQRQQPAPSIRTEIVNLPRTLESADEKIVEEALKQLVDVLEVVTVAERAQGRQIEAPKLKYHSGSGLLLITGSMESIGVATRILQNLRSTIQMGAGAFKNIAPDAVETTIKR